MMYDHMTFEYILDRMLDRVPDTIDKREGSVIYDACAPAAAELAMIYSLLAAEMDRAFPDTATDVDLTNKAKERSVFRLPATAVVRKGVFTGADGKGLDVPLGSRFSGGDVNYVATERIESGAFKLTAEELGSIGNEHTGILFPIDYIDGLASATLTDILIYGEDEESDEALRERYYASLQALAFGGNVADYRAKTEKIPGVGACKVFPAWNGGGTVMLVITDSTGGVPTPELVQMLQQEIDPPGLSGQGRGWAPVGHAVTVEGVIGVTVNVEFKLTFEQGYTWVSVKANVTAALQAYFEDMVKGWADVESITVRNRQLEAKILTVNGVLDIANTKLNGATGNLTLVSTEIPLLGTVNHA